MWDIKSKIECVEPLSGIGYYLNHVGYKGLGFLCLNQPIFLYYLNHVGYKVVLKYADAVIEAGII